MEREDFLERRNDLEDFNIQWSKFRDPLRREDRLVLDEMFKALEIYKEACATMTERERFAAAALAMLVEQRKKSIRIEKQIEDHERRIRRQGEVWLFAGV